MQTALIHESFQHFIPTGEGWAKGLESLGWTVFRLPDTQYRIQDLDQNLNLLIVHDADARKCVELKKYKQNYPNSKIVILTSDFKQYFKEMISEVDLWINLSLKNTKLENQFKSNGMKFDCISLAAHEKVSFPIEIEKTYDVSFIGQVGKTGHGYRDEDKYLFPVVESRYKGFYAGFDHKNTRHYIIPYNQINKIYNQTKVNLNFHYKNQKIETEDPESRIELNGRTFDIAMSGNFQISDHPSILEEFEDSIPYVTSENWMEQIDYYLKNDNIRKSLTEKSRKIALEKHSYKNRVERILKNIL